MSYYFKLQLKRLFRWFQETGIPPILGIPVLMVGFILLSKFVFTNSVYAKWIYSFAAVLPILKLANNQRSNQLLKIFKKQDFYKIRFLENLLVLLPFLIYLLYEQQFLIALGLALLSVIFVKSISVSFWNRTIPTPFKKNPFENIAGFRQSFPYIILFYLIAAQAIHANNFNLAIFSLGLVLLTGLIFYSKPEKPYFVWIFADTFSVFLFKKIKNAFVGASILSIPLLCCLCIAFPENWKIIVGVQVIAYVYICAMVLGKYAAFPREMHLPRGILFLSCFAFPPLLLMVIPFFYFQSKQKIKTIIE